MLQICGDISALNNISLSRVDEKCSENGSSVVAKNNLKNVSNIEKKRDSLP
jgi:hypothetical protein